MNRPILVCTFLAMASAALAAQQGSQSSPYEGTSSPPADDTIVTSSTPPAKPPAGHPMDAPQTGQAPGQAQTEPQPTSVDPSANNPGNGTDSDIVPSAQPAPAPRDPALMERDQYASDPDGDIVHPHALRPGELGEGTTIRVQLLNRLSTAGSERGEAFRSRVATDVLRDGEVLIPAGAEIDGKVVEVSGGHPGGHGSMRLRPEIVILPNGTRYRLYAEVTGAPGSRTRVGAEGAINPGSRLKRDSVEYGGAVGAGVTTGAIVGGPVGAVTGGLIGVGVVTAHLLISHPQATLETGTTLMLTLTEPLLLTPANTSGN